MEYFRKLVEIELKAYLAAIKVNPLLQEFMGNIFMKRTIYTWISQYFAPTQSYLLTISIKFKIFLK